MVWDIQGYIGASDLKLGMRPSEASRFAGEPFRSHVSKQNGFLFEMREPDQPDLTYSDDALIEISFTSAVEKVMFDNRDVFHSSPIDFLNQILSRDSNVWLIYEMLVAYDLGLFLHGFHTDNEECRIGTFVKGAWDYMRDDPSSEPFVMP